jgi:hypothetical protein
MSEYSRRLPGFVRWQRGADTHTLHLRVLGYEEDREWCALCLEMDLRGYGATFEDAMEELHDAIVNQFTFAMQMNKPELLLCTAEQKYHAMYARTKRKALIDYVTGAPESETRHQISELPIPSADEIPREIVYVQA